MGSEVTAMNRMSYTKSGLLLLSLGLASGCSGGGRASFVAGDSTDAFVEVVVRNRTNDVVRVEVRWADTGGPPQIFSNRVLGSLAGGQTGSIDVPHRLRRIRLNVRLLRPGRPDLPPSPVSNVSGPAVDIGPGDRLEWEIVRIDELWFIRLTAHYSPGAPLRVSPEAGPHDGENARSPPLTSE